MSEARLASGATSEARLLPSVPDRGRPTCASRASERSERARGSERSERPRVIPASAVRASVASEPERASVASERGLLTSLIGYAGLGLQGNLTEFTSVILYAGGTL